MNFNLLRTNVRLCAIAPALAALSACPLLVHAESVVSIPMTVVTGSRYELPLEKVLTDVSVITREDIAASQAASVADLLRDQPGFEFGRNGGPGS
ncbi:MAG: TonB-dependent receptor plug domain-containing protein, partial [Burkholderiaceae bacterium]|nr:TonB-dependent receptor plug domain-containing protein [Burkholderiaceae bacterium]